MHGKALTSYPFRVETNVNAKVIGHNRTIKQSIDTHNMATANLTEGVVKFLRGEFTESYISGLLPNIGNNFNIADQYIPAYMGMGVAGVAPGNNGIGLKVETTTGFAPSYSDKALVSEILPVANPARAIVHKSDTNNASLSQAASLILSAAYHFESRAKTQVFSLAASKTVYPKGTVFYLSDSLYPGKRILQRINSIELVTHGWSYLESTDYDAEAGARPTGILYYTQQIPTESGSTTTKDIEVLSIDFNTGEMVVISPEGFAFTSGLDIAYDPVNFDFIYANDYGTVPFIQDGLERTYYVSELGLFSGDFSNKNAKLLARVMLDSDTPLKISEGDYVLITWQVGVYALDDALYTEDIETGEDTESTSLKYVTQEEATSLIWSEITELDENGNPIEDPFIDVLEAGYKVLACDFTTKDTALLTVESAEGLHENFPASFSLNNGQITGVVTNIAKSTPVTLENDWIFNPALIRSLGIDDGLLLSNLIYCQYPQKSIGIADYFEYDPEAIEAQTGISYMSDTQTDSPQMLALKSLQNKDLITEIRENYINGHIVKYIKLNSEKLKTDFNIILDTLSSYVIKLDTSNSLVSYTDNEFMYYTNFMTISTLIDGLINWNNLPEGISVPQVTVLLSDATELTNKNMPEIQKNSIIRPIGGYWSVSSITNSFKFPRLNYLFMDKDSAKDFIDTAGNNEIYYTLADISTCTIELPTIYYDYQVELAMPTSDVESQYIWDNSKYTVRINIAEDIDKTNKRTLAAYVYKHIPVDSSDDSSIYYEYADGGKYKLISAPDNQINFTITYKKDIKEGETV